VPRRCWLGSSAATDAARQTASRTARTWRIGDAARWGQDFEKSTLPEPLGPNTYSWTDGLADAQRSEVLALERSCYGPYATRHTRLPETDRVGDPDDATRQG
jgi:hypothetical protein